jgi:hypothetical protein
MGLAILTVGVCNPALPGRTVPVGFPVDSGAVDSVVPAGILRHLGDRAPGGVGIPPGQRRNHSAQEGCGGFQVRRTGGRRDVVFAKKGPGPCRAHLHLRAWGWCWVR